MASPSFDTVLANWAATSTGSSASHASNTACSASNEVILAFISYENTTNVVSSVTESSSTLTFTFLGKVRNTTSGAHDQTIEVWAAQSTGQFNSGAASITYTVNWAGGGVDDACILIAGVETVGSLSSPLDPNASIPASEFNTTSATPPAVTFSTTNADDLLIGIVSRANCCGGQATPSGWTNLGSNQTGGGLNGQVLSVDYKSVSATQASVSYANAGSTADISWAAMVIAITADAGGGSGGNPSKAACVMVGF